LGRYLDDLIVDNTIGIRNLCQEGEEVGGNVSTVDVDREERSHEVGHVDFVYIHQGEGLHRAVANLQVLVRALEVGHGKRPLLELERHEAMKVLVNLRLAQLTVHNTFLLQDVGYLGHLYMEVLPSFSIVFHEGIVRTFLRDDEKGAYVGIRPSLEVVEVTFGEELLFSLRLMVIFLLAENILFLQGIPLAERLDDVGQYVLKEPILVGIGTILLHGILNLKEDRWVAFLRPQHRIEQFPVLIPDVLQLGKEFIEWFSFLCHNR